MFGIYDIGTKYVRVNNVEVTEYSTVLKRDYNKAPGDSFTAPWREGRSRCWYMRLLTTPYLYIKIPKEKNDSMIAEKYIAS